MVHLYNLNIKRGAKHAGGDLGQLKQQIHTQGHIGREKDRNALRSLF